MTKYMIILVLFYLFEKTWLLLVMHKTVGFVII